MKCEDTRFYLEPYIQGDLSEIEAEGVREHLARCRTCAWEREQLMHRIDMVRLSKPETGVMPAELDYVVRQRLLKRPRRKRILPVAVVLALAAGILFSTINAGPLPRWWEEIPEPHLDNILAICSQVIGEHDSEVDIMNFTVEEFDKYLCNLDPQVYDVLASKLADYWLQADMMIVSPDAKHPEKGWGNGILIRADIEYLRSVFPERSFPDDMTWQEIQQAMDEATQRIIQQMHASSFRLIGTPPKSFHEATGKQAWHAKMSTFAATIELEDSMYYPQGPIFGHGASICGYISVHIFEGYEPGVDENLIENIYAELSKAAELAGISDLPVMFHWATGSIFLQGTVTSIDYDSESGIGSIYVEGLDTKDVSLAAGVAGTDAYTRVVRLQDSGEAQEKLCIADLKVGQNVQVWALFITHSLPPRATAHKIVILD